MKKLIYFILFIFFFNSCLKKDFTSSFSPVFLEKNHLNKTFDITKKNQKNFSYEILQSKSENPKNEISKDKISKDEIIELPPFKSNQTIKSKKKYPLLKKIDYEKLTPLKKPVIINVENMPILDFIIYALGETLKVPFAADEKIKLKKDLITLYMPKPEAPAKVLERVINLLEDKSLYIEERAEALFIYSKPPQPQKLFDIRFGLEVPESPVTILQVIPLKYVKSSDIIELIENYVTTNVKIKSYKETILLLYGEASQIKQITEIIKNFDIPYLKEKKIAFLKITYWKVDEFLIQLKQILSAIGLKTTNIPSKPGIMLIPVKSLESIFVVAPDEESLKLVLDWKEKLDIPEAAGEEEKIFTYKPKYSKASDLVESIKKLYGIAEEEQIKKRERKKITKLPVKFKIASDDARNIVAVLTTPKNFEKILKLLKKLDVPPRQVLIEATIAELSLMDELQYGLEWYIRNRLAGGNYTISSLFGLPTTPGFTYQFIANAEKFKALLYAFAMKDLVHILSTPRLLVLDNQEAIIQVGSDVPIVVSEATTQIVTNIIRSIQYRHTGVILKVKPTINTEGMVTLYISQEVSEMGASPPGIESPTILIRKINTNVVAQSGQSVILGGLISENRGYTVNKVPILGDIPILGNLFKTTTESKRKSELIVILTPTIINNPEEAAYITKELKTQLKWLKNNEKSRNY